MKSTDKPLFSAKAFLTEVGVGKTIADYKKDQLLFGQGQKANSVFYIQKGKVKLTVVSQEGKEADLAVLGSGDFVGEECLSGQTVRMATARAVSKSSILRLTKKDTLNVLHKQPKFSELFLSHMLCRNSRLEKDLVCQLFNSSEKRLARVILRQAQFGKQRTPDAVIPKVSQERLAKSMGTPLSEVSFFMNKFRKLGLIGYKKGRPGMTVRNSLLNVVLHD
jgi:CRP-like cAMP-binding protein